MSCPGDVLSDRYRLQEPIGSGGMGEVWRATDVSLGRAVAVKILRSTLTDPIFDARFRAEARMMAAVNHRNVVDVYDYGHSALADGTNVSYLVMAYVAGQSLLQRIDDAGRLSVAETMSVVAQAADAIHAAHLGGIVHRDVKPANLLVQPNGTVILVDFGVARSSSVTGVTTADGVLGTAMYMAPEQASGRPVSPATDIYALGAVAYHCLAGHPPFTGGGALEIALRHVSDDPPPLPDDIPPAVHALTMRALAKDPTERYPAAADFAAAARAVTARRGSMMSARRRHAVTGASSRRRGPVGLAAMSGAALALLLGLVGLVALLGSPRPASTGPAGGPPPPVAPADPGGARPTGDLAGAPAAGADRGRPGGRNGTGGNDTDAVPAGIPAVTGSPRAGASATPAHTGASPSPPATTVPPTEPPESAAPTGTAPPPPSPQSTPSPQSSLSAESTPSPQSTSSPPPSGDAATGTPTVTVTAPAIPSSL